MVFILRRDRRSIVSGRRDAPFGSRGRAIPVVLLAKAADASHILHALLEGDEATILGAARAVAITTDA
jgi:hypothetical protein